MKNNEFRFIHREETFTDHAIDELASSKGKCLCCIQFKRCSIKDCQKCSHNKQYQKCYASMSDYDRNRLLNRTNDYYLEYSKYPTAYMNHKEYIRYYSKYILITIGFLALFLLPVSFFCPEVLGLLIAFSLAIIFAVTVGNSNFLQGYRNSKFVEELKRQESLQNQPPVIE